ncbi:MAG TPA: protein kinase [Actinomycetota bacterium]|nr:protein kinase [Actinomycetota bacterium]
MIDVRLAGRYRLESEVGSGGMTTVWMAVDEVLERRIAVKILQRHLLSNEVFCTRFRQEALVAGGLTHPTIAAVYDTGLYDDAPYVVTEYLGGGSLAKALSVQGSLPAARVVSIGADICEALAVAHANGVSHGNLKPSNILFSDAGPLLGLVKVTDFGVGNAALGGDLTATGALLGTLSFLAPEVLQGADPGPAADIYSLGVVLFRALTGRPPRAADSELSGSGRPRTTTTHPRDLTPSIPRSLDAAIARALADDPSDRFADAAELGRLLRTATQGRAIPGDEPSMVPIPAPLPPAGRPRAGEDKGASTEPPPRAPAPGPGQPLRRLASSRGGAAEFVRTEGRWLAPVVLVVLLAIAIVVGVLQLSGHIPGLTGAGSKAPAPAPSVQVVSMQPGGILKPNPQGGDTGEHSNLVPDAFNGQNPPWETENYTSADFGGLRPGIGIYGDLGSSMTLSKIEVDSPTPGWAGSIRYSDDGQNWSPAPGPGQSVTAAGTQDFNVTGDGPHRYWMVWITSLPQAYNFQAKISDIKAFH